MTRRAAWRAVAAAAALVVLNQSLTFYNIWPTPKVRWPGHLSVELAIVVTVLALVAWRRGVVPAWLLRFTAAAWVLLVAGRYLDVVAPALYGRPVNLFWDARHLSAVAAMMTDAVAGPVLVGVVGAVVVLIGGVYAVARLAFGALHGALVAPRGQLVLGVLALATIGAYGGVGAAGGRGLSAPAFAPPVTATFWNQARLLVTQLTTRRVAVVASKRFADSDLSRVDGADVFLTFVESYGAVTYDRDDVSRALTPARDRLHADIRASGREVLSAFVESPTFGGSSWLAHVSLLTGVETRTEGDNATLMAQERETLVTAFARRGYRTVALMPGLQQAWPEGAFYGFDRIYGTPDFDYRGPRFGWWTVPDQFALARLDVLEAVPEPAKPRFVFFPTTSTHAPFGPTAPYQPDWNRLLSAAPYEEPTLGRALSRTPDYLNLTPSYVNAVDYALASVGGYLRTRADRDLVMVMLGDHQPAAAVAGEGASWDVPVHVIARPGPVLDRMKALGFVAGLEPPRRPIAKMHALLPMLLEAFGDPLRSGRSMSDPHRSQPAQDQQTVRR